MKEYSIEDLKNIYKERVAHLSITACQEETDAIVFIDNEEHRDPAIRYYSGHTSDAILVIFKDSFTVLIAWDENLAKKNSIVDKIIPYSRYKNDQYDAVRAALNSYKAIKVNKVELPPYLTYPEYLKFVDKLNSYHCRCIEDGLYNCSIKQRLQKDEYEIECTKEAAKVGDIIINQIEEKIKSGQIKTESDVALLIEKVCRDYGCERTGFDTLAAGPSRSFAIHAFPGYTNAAWPDQGLSILDFGVVYKGYTSDTTVTVAKGPLTKEQEEQLNLVEKAYQASLDLYSPEHTIYEAAKMADLVFANAKRKMPHSLGHGIGLQIHEGPRVSLKVDQKEKFLPGMIVTCEPGLYDAEIGGCRLENDVLITENGHEVLTHSKIIRI